MGMFIGPGAVSSSQATPGAAIVRGPFSLTFATPNLNNGVAFYTPTVGDILLDIWFELATSFNGTTPQGDIGSFSGTNFGLYGGVDSPMPLNKTADFEIYGNGLLQGFAGSGFSLAMVSAFPGTAGGAFTNMERIVPARFVGANPLLFVASQNGQKGGAATGATAGAVKIYVVTATPTS